jgi:hypothetical protein
LSDLIVSDFLADWDEPQLGPPLNAYQLHLRSGREAFLERLVAIGEPGVFSAVAHVWGSLARPAEARCTQMGLLAGTGGKGKVALRKVLTAFISEWLGHEMLTLPRWAGGQPLVDWHQKVVRIWAHENEREIAVVRKFAAILNGEPPAHSLDPPSVVILRGPWRAA